MPNNSLLLIPNPLPKTGPLTPLAVYRRADLHARFGGSRYKGIVVSSRESVILLFHTSESGQQFYEDGFDSEGIYWYSGEGAKGDMKWGRSNQAVRDHYNDGRDLLFFERAQRQGGLWRFTTYMTKIEQKLIEKTGKDGQPRKAVLFGLIPLNSDHKEGLEQWQVSEGVTQLMELRQLARDAGRDNPSKGSAVVHYYQRSAVIRQYCLTRSDGICEGCGKPAPFKSPLGPFLEVHHLNKLSDGGPDRPEGVAALCPNCHRRCHYSNDAVEFSRIVQHSVEQREQMLNN